MVMSYHLEWRVVPVGDVGDEAGASVGGAGGGNCVEVVEGGKRRWWRSMKMAGV